MNADSFYSVTAPWQSRLGGGDARRCGCARGWKAEASHGTL